jgi:hypothetical protein
VRIVPPQDPASLIDNAESHAVHRALGFAETERVVYFRRSLPHVGA